MTPARKIQIRACAWLTTTERDELLDAVDETERERDELLDFESDYGHTSECDADRGRCSCLVGPYEAALRAVEVARTALAEAERERDEARAWRKRVLEEVTKHATRDFPPLVITESGALVPIATYEEAARGRHLAAGAFVAVREAMRERTSVVEGFVDVARTALSKIEAHEREGHCGVCWGVACDALEKLPPKRTP